MAVTKNKTSEAAAKARKQKIVVGSGVQGSRTAENRGVL